MSDPQFDTAGFVVRLRPARGGEVVGEEVRWADLTAFQQGVFAQALEELNVYLSGFPSHGLRTARFRDLSSGALDSLLRDCTSFENIAQGLGVGKLGELEGRRFWRGRNEGALTGAFRAAFPPADLRLLEDGTVGVRAPDEARA